MLRPLFLITCFTMLAPTLGGCLPAGQIDLLHARPWKFIYLGSSLAWPGNEIGLRTIRLPGRWNEALPGTPSTGVGYFRLDFRLPRRELARLNVLFVGRLESAAILKLNGEIIGMVGRPGKNRGREFSRIHPEFLEIRPGLLRKSNRLEIMISNFHTRGGALLKLHLSNHHVARRDFALRLLREALLLGMLGVAGIFFLIIWMTDRNERAYLFFALLLPLIMIRGAASNGLLEFAAPARDWTDWRLLLETWSGISMTPAVLFWFIRDLFPVLRENPRPWSRRRDLLRIYFTYFSGAYLTVGGLFLSVWFLYVFDASIYTAQLDLILRVFIVPALFFFLVLLVIAAGHGQPGVWIILAGFLVLMAAALSDIFTILGGTATPLRASAGMLIFVLCMSVVLGLRIHNLHFQVLRARDSLRGSNQELIRMGRLKDKFLLNTARVISRPLSESVEIALSILDKPGAGLGTAQLKLLSSLADRGRESLRRFQRLEHYLNAGDERPVLTPLAPREFFGREIIALEKSAGTTFEYDPTPGLPLIMGDPLSLRMLLVEFKETAALASPSAACVVKLESDGTAAVLHLRLRYESREPAAGDPGDLLDTGMPVLERIAEIHGGRPLTRRGVSEGFAWLQWSLRLDYADTAPHEDPTLGAKIKHARFLSAAGFLQQGSREFERLRNTGALKTRLDGETL